MKNKLMVLTILLGSLSFSGVASANPGSSILSLLEKIIEQSGRKTNCSGLNNDGTQQKFCLPDS